MAKRKLGKDTDAINDFDNAIRHKSNYADAYYRRGLAKRAVGRTIEAKQDFQTALTLAKQAKNEYLKTHIESLIRDLY